MSTPISIDPPPKAHLRTGSQQEREFQNEIETMIAMQYHEQQLAEGNLMASSGIEPMNTTSRTQQQQQQQQRVTIQFARDSSGESSGKLGAPPSATTPGPSTRSTTPSQPSQAGVGTGTLLFPEDYNYGAIQQPPHEEQPHYQQQQQHDFHYGNPDYIRDDDSEKTTSWCEKCCCVCTPLLNLLRQEQLRRSFCYGAIDGTLTGSGIVSAFCALGVLNIHTTWEVRSAIFCLSAAACFADSLCVAIGHIWTSYVVSSSHAADRATERIFLENSKGDAKAKLIDMLMDRGVLKIDAMSLADTLEGYPDLFVNALVGDSLCAGPDDGELEEEHHPNSRKFPSYGQLGNEQSPEQANVEMVVKESQREGTFMMVGFATFALIPSLLWLYLPLLVAPSSHQKADSGEATGISLSSLIISITALIMWSLGAWKSSFLGSNSIVVGIENVIVLLICVLSAYGMGLLLRYCFDDKLELFVSA